jgi:hypothetical protein
MEPLLTGRNLELDIYLPEIKKAIEYNCKWTHRHDYTKYKDEQKILQCKEKGVDLLVLDDREWHKDNNNQVDKIKMFINVLEEI